MIFAARVETPKAELAAPVVFLERAKVPRAELPTAVVFACPAQKPVNVFEWPVRPITSGIVLVPAPKPTKRLRPESAMAELVKSVDVAPNSIN